MRFQLPETHFGEVQDNKVPPYFLNCLGTERKQTLKAKAESALITCLPNECFNEIPSEKNIPEKNPTPLLVLQEQAPRLLVAIGCLVSK